jgi:hypothetical protein
VVRSSERNLRGLFVANTGNFVVLLGFCWYLPTLRYSKDGRVAE